MRTVFDIQYDELVDKLAEVLVSYPATCAYLYGSFLTDNLRKDSDIDIALLFEFELDDYKQMNFCFDIENELETIFSFDRFEIRPLNNAPEDVKENIIKNGAIYCSDQNKRVEFESATHNKFLDMKNFFESNKDIMYKKIKEQYYG